MKKKDEKKCIQEFGYNIGKDRFQTSYRDVEKKIQKKLKKIFGSGKNWSTSFPTGINNCNQAMNVLPQLYKEALRMKEVKEKRLWQKSRKDQGKKERRKNQDC